MTSYDKALERARKLKSDYQEKLDKIDKNTQLAGRLRDGISALEMVFPELRESEEERALRIIRKRMCHNPAPISDEDRRFVENWLEKRQVLQSTEADESTKRLNDNWMKQHFDDYEERKPTEWSEEDKRKLNRIYEILGYAADDKGFLTSKRIIGDKEAIELQDFLKSLRPSWKPSEEQMRALQKAVNKLAQSDVSDSVRLSIMYDNLKKLM